jgi:hypothetical protein
MASGSAISAFVAGIPVRLVQGVVGRAEHVLVAQNKYRNVKDLKGQTIGSLNPGGLVDALLRQNQNEKANLCRQSITCLCSRASCLVCSPHSISTGLSYAPALRFIDPSIGGDMAGKKKILIVEDHLEIRRLIRSLIKLGLPSI